MFSPDLDVTQLMAVLFIGAGATLVMDLWALFLKYTFKIPSLNYCLVGRWLGLMPSGVFIHANIAEAPRAPFECGLGWLAHYLIGILFALLLVVFTSGHWLSQPTLLAALIFGFSTVLVPFLIMQPAFGLGVAAARTPSPMQARFRSILAHCVFGIGLYLSALVFNHFMGHG